MAAADPVPTDARERRDVVVPVPGPEDPAERAWLVLPHRHPVRTLLDETRDAVVGLAETLAAVLPVTVLAHPRDAGAARLVPPEVDLLRAPVGSPLLGRTGPSFVRRPEGLAAVAWRSAAGLTGTGPLDGAAATAVAEAAGLPLLTPLLCAPRGAWVTDGEGTAVVAADPLLDGRINGAWTPGQVAAEFAALLGITRVLWLPPAPRPDTGPWGGPGHLASWVRLRGDGEAAVHWRGDRFHPEHPYAAAVLRFLQGADDAAGRPLRVRTVTGAAQPAAYDPAERGPRSLLDTLPLGAAVLRPAFEDAAGEEAAAAACAALHPGLPQLSFPAPPLLRLAGALNDLVLLQPRP